MSMAENLSSQDGPSIVTALFGPDLYRPDAKTATRLASDVRRIPELRRTWVPVMGDRLFDPRAPVGTYDPRRKRIPLEESQAEARPLKNFPALRLAVDAPRRHGFRARGRSHLRAMVEAIPVPD